MKNSGKVEGVKSPAQPITLGKYQAQNFESLLGMKGFSDKMLTAHFKLYQGYVTNTNTAMEEMKSLLQGGKEKTPEFTEIRRRFGWEWNGMRLHEYYFSNLGGKGELDRSDLFHRFLTAQYGNVEQWKKDFTSAGAMRGIGWVVLYYDHQSKRLFNIWIEQHNGNHLVGAVPLVVLDVFEHAYMPDYGTDKTQYLTAFFDNLNWSVVAERFEEASADQKQPQQ